MTANVLEIRSNGALNSIQDLGRRGWLSEGVSTSGAMDGEALRLANAMVGNRMDCGAVEISIFPFRIKVLADTELAWTGANSEAVLDGVVQPPWWSTPVRAGQSLTIDPPRLGSRVYLACAGGVDVPPVLGSRSTDFKGGFGGFEGRGLKRGDLLSAGAVETAGRRAFGVLPPGRKSHFDGLQQGTVTLRAIAAAEYDKFTAEARTAFEETLYAITSEANRTGYRLDGAPLKLREPLELLSHGIVPGTVQVPPNGLPIVQLADANTCGGYPKIATVVATDLWRIAQAAPGTQVRFVLIGAADAAQIERDQHQELARLIATCARWRQAR